MQSTEKMKKMDRLSSQVDEDAVAVYPSENQTNPTQLRQPYVYNRSGQPVSNDHPRHHLVYSDDNDEEDTEQFDIALIYSEEDTIAADRFKSFIKENVVLKNGEPPKICTLKDSLHDIQSEFHHVSQAIQRSTLMFLYLTRNFIDDTWADIQKEECLMESINKKDKRWCVVPIHTEPKRAASYTVPFGLSSLKGIDISNIKSLLSDVPLSEDKMADYVIDSMTSMLNKYLKKRLCREEEERHQLKIKKIKEENEERLKVMERKRSLNEERSKSKAEMKRFQQDRATPEQKVSAREEPQNASLESTKPSENNNLLASLLESNPELAKQLQQLSNTEQRKKGDSTAEFEGTNPPRNDDKEGGDRELTAGETLGAQEQDDAIENDESSLASLEQSLSDDKMGDSAYLTGPLGDLRLRDQSCDVDDRVSKECTQSQHDVVASVSAVGTEEVSDAKVKPATKGHPIEDKDELGNSQTLVENCMTQRDPNVDESVDSNEERRGSENDRAEQQTKEFTQPPVNDFILQAASVQKDAIPTCSETETQTSLPMSAALPTEVIHRHHIILPERSQNYQHTAPQKMVIFNVTGQNVNINQGQEATSLQEDCSDEQESVLYNSTTDDSLHHQDTEASEITTEGTDVSPFLGPQSSEINSSMNVSQSLQQHEHHSEAEMMESVNRHQARPSPDRQLCDIYTDMINSGEENRPQTSANLRNKADSGYFNKDTEDYQRMNKSRVLPQDADASPASGRYNISEGDSEACCPLPQEPARAPVTRPNRGHLVGASQSKPRVAMVSPLVKDKRKDDSNHTEPKTMAASGETQVKERRTGAQEQRSRSRTEDSGLDLSIPEKFQLDQNQPTFRSGTPPSSLKDKTFFMSHSQEGAAQALPDSADLCISSNSDTVSQMCTNSQGQDGNFETRRNESTQVCDNEQLTTVAGTGHRDLDSTIDFEMVDGNIESSDQCLNLHNQQPFGSSDLSASSRSRSADHPIPSTEKAAVKNNHKQNSRNQTHLIEESSEPQLPMTASPTQDQQSDSGALSAAADVCFDEVAEAANEWQESQDLRNSGGQRRKNPPKKKKVPTATLR